VVSQNPASAFDVPVLPLGYWASFKIVRCRPCRRAALRSLRCSFAGSAAGRIWSLRWPPILDREEGSPDRGEA
jgi:hypothetical protein